VQPVKSFGTIDLLKRARRLRASCWSS